MHPNVLRKWVKDSRENAEQAFPGPHGAAPNMGIESFRQLADGAGKVREGSRVPVEVRRSLSDSRCVSEQPKTRLQAAG